MNRKLVWLFQVFLFSLIFILGVISTIAYWKGMTELEPRGTPLSFTLAEMLPITEELESFKSETGYYPNTYQEVIKALFQPAAWESLINSKKQFEETYLLIPIRDYWEQEFRYLSPGIHNKQSFDLFSLGQDRITGSADDINNWDVQKSWLRYYQPGIIQQLGYDPIFAIFLLAFWLNLLYTLWVVNRKQK